MMFKNLYKCRKDIPCDSVQVRGALCGLGMIFMWAFMGYFQEEFPFYAPLFLTILASIAIHEMGFEFVGIPVLFVTVHTVVVIYYCFAFVDRADYRIFLKLGLWTILFFVIPFLYMFIWTTILDKKETEPLKIPKV